MERIKLFYPISATNSAYLFIPTLTKKRLNESRIVNIGNFRAEKIYRLFGFDSYTIIKRDNHNLPNDLHGYAAEMDQEVFDQYEQTLNMYGIKLRPLVGKLMNNPERLILHGVLV